MICVQPNAMLLLLAVFIAASAGCGAKNETAAKMETSHLRVLTSLYTKASSRLGRIPRDQQEFKQAIASVSLPLETLKVTSIDELFVSERDGQPFVVVYGRAPKDSDVVAYEQVGLNGKRQVGHRIGLVEEVDDARYKELTAVMH